MIAVGDMTAGSNMNGQYDCCNVSGQCDCW